MALTYPYNGTSANVNGPKTRKLVQAQLEETADGVVDVSPENDGTQNESRMAVTLVP